MPYHDQIEVFGALWFGNQDSGLQTMKRLQLTLDSYMGFASGPKKYKIRCETPMSLGTNQAAAGSGQAPNENSFSPI